LDHVPDIDRATLGNTPSSQKRIDNKHTCISLDICNAMTTYCLPQCYMPYVLELCLLHVKLELKHHFMLRKARHYLKKNILN